MNRMYYDEKTKARVYVSRCSILFLREMTLILVKLNYI